MLQYGADIVIWGWYRTTAKAVSLSTHFDVLRPPQYFPGLEPEARGFVRKATVDKLESFTLQSDVSSEMLYLSLVAVGLTRFAARDWDAAIVSFSDALNQTSEPRPPEQGMLFYWRGSAYLFEENYNRAIIDFDRAINLAPSFAPAYYNRGSIYAGKGERLLAIMDYGRAIDLEPAYADPYYARGIAYAQGAEIEKAISDFKAFLERSDNLYCRTQAEAQLKGLEGKR